MKLLESGGFGPPGQVNQNRPNIARGGYYRVKIQPRPVAAPGLAQIQAIRVTTRNPPVPGMQTEKLCRVTFH